jgi:hypothetical protein
MAVMMRLLSDRFEGDNVVAMSVDKRFVDYVQWIALTHCLVLPVGSA